MRIKSAVLFPKKVYQRLRGRFPSALPRGKTDLESFSESILDIYQLPNFPSYHHSIASMILHLGPMTTHQSKYFFARCIRKAMANEVAYQKMQELKKALEDTKAQAEPNVEKAPASE